MSDFFYKRENISKILELPGIYKFFDKNDKIIYIGKAKNLKKRVSSYFSSKDYGIKTKKLISELKKIEIVIVNSEFEALLLENNLIKNHKPKYNILLKDDKSYPYISISNEEFPRIFTVYKSENYQGKLYGPFSKVKYANDILDLIRSIFPFRSCNYNLSEKNIEKKKFKECLEFYIGNCKAPCTGREKKENYLENIKMVEFLLKGNFNQIKKSLKDKMIKLSDNLEFEKAEILKKKIENIENYQSKSIIVSTSIENLQVYGILSDEKYFFVNFMQIINGSINFSKNIIVEKKLEQENEILESLIFDISSSYDFSCEEKISNIEIISFQEKILTIVPKIGDKKKLILMSLKNSLNAKENFYQKKENDSPKILNKALILLQRDLDLASIPEKIVCFDNSNFSGNEAVASMVFFENGKPNKNLYKKFSIKTVAGIDDFASMREIVKRAFDKKDFFVDLIVIDGGKGQLSSAIESLKELDIYEKVDIISIAKKFEYIYKGEKSEEIILERDSLSLKLIQKIRDEAHRFALRYHISKRSKNFLKSQLEKIKNIGPKSIEILYKNYSSIDEIKSSCKEDLEKILGKRGEIVFNYFLKN
jgi:excinuclease ABC subunit C